MSASTATWCAPESIGEALRLRAAVTPRGRGFVSTERASRWAEVIARAEGIACALRARRVRRVAVAAWGGDAAALAMMGAWLADACVVPLPTTLPEVDLLALAARSGASYVLHDASHRGVAQATRLQPLSIEALLEDPPVASCEPASSGPGLHPAAVLFTSGTTGAPKAVVLTHAGMLAAARASSQRIGTDATDGWLVCMPLYHVGGLVTLVRAAVDGFALELHDRFDAAAVADALASGRVSGASLVARMLERVLASPGAPNRFPMGLKAILVGGGASPGELLARASGRGLPVLRTYGLTEACSQVATEEPAAARHRSCGPPLPGVEVRVAPDEEIHVRGPSLMAGYEATPGAPPTGLDDDGWLHTGDVGHLDERGEVVVLDRRVDLIVSGGENVSPARVEAVLAQAPGVRDVAVIGEADASWGQRVVAIVRVEPDADIAALEAWARVRLAPHERPRRWVRTAADLPRTPSGKLERRALGALVGGLTSREGMSRER